MPLPTALVAIQKERRRRHRYVSSYPCDKPPPGRRLQAPAGLRLDGRGIGCAKEGWGDL